jgi:3-dehydrosphinganine reductase
LEISYENKIVVITGGSSGIGLALAKEFVRHNAKVILISSNENKLMTARASITGINPHAVIDTVAADIAIDKQADAAINTIGSKYGTIDVMINCAGISTCAKFKDHSNEQLQKEMQVNYMGSVFVTKAAWPFLKASKGQLSFVSSVAGYIGVIGYSSYAPTKFALTGLAECLRFEGKDDGIMVSIIYPPDTETPMLKHSRLHCIPETLALSKNIKLKTAEEVASIYIDGLRKKNLRSIVMLRADLYVGLKTISPPLLFMFQTLLLIRRGRSS